jgi:hypothetical protein
MVVVSQVKIKQTFFSVSKFFPLHKYLLLIDPTTIPLKVKRHCYVILRIEVLAL